MVKKKNVEPRLINLKEDWCRRLMDCVAFVCSSLFQVYFSSFNNKKTLYLTDVHCLKQTFGFNSAFFLTKKKQNKLFRHYHLTLMREIRKLLKNIYVIIKIIIIIIHVGLKNFHTKLCLIGKTAKWCHFRKKEIYLTLLYRLAKWLYVFC